MSDEWGDLAAVLLFWAINRMPQSLMHLTRRERKGNAKDTAPLKLVVWSLPFQERKKNARVHRAAYPLFLADAPKEKPQRSFVLP